MCYALCENPKKYIPLFNPFNISYSFNYEAVSTCYPRNSAEPSSSASSFS